MSSSTDESIHLKIKREKVIMGIKVIQIDARLDTDNAFDVKQELLKVVHKHPNGVLIDCKKTEFIDSSGLAVLVSAMKTCNNMKIPFYLISLTPKVKQIIEITKLSAFFNILNNKQEAELHLKV